MFPVSDRAVDVANVLERELKNPLITLRTGRAVQLLTEEGASCRSPVRGRGLNIGRRRSCWQPEGKSYPLTGSTGDGYRLAEEQGHTIIPLAPSLIPVVTEEDET